ncbi:peptidylprolyl isomerase [Namhaeicola litoreus]|uniref:Peptidyl-prolyl cis-trans isomerase n=1 Tax=Namhaeicola litoreus TaxID=1052145 RepID=A0ABW3XYJ4_9FLAO
MIKKLLLPIILFVYAIATYAQSEIKCEINTASGMILIELYPEKAPKTVANFLNYVRNKDYDGSTFFRVCTPENEAEREVQIQVIQGGDMAEEKLFLPIQIETTKQTGLKHLRGAISMARGEPNSAQSSFFICVTDEPELDFGGERNPDGFGFAAFGQVTEGMDIVEKIQQGENEQQMLVHPVRIESIRIIE